VAAVGTTLINEKTLEAISAVTDRTRLQILFLLGEQGRMCVGDITGQFRLSRPAISHHLKILKTNGLVRSEKVGQEVFYWVEVSHLAAMLRGLADTLEQCCPAVEPA
jgi:DNA-binding transcriptional ArsR family regulator